MENKLVLSQRANAQMQRYTIAEEHPSLQAARIQSKLQQRLGPEYVSYRAGPGGGRVPYLEANKVIELAHEIFGHDSWSSEIVQFQEMSREKNESGRWTISIMCTAKVTIRSGAFHQDCGFGNAENQKSIAAAMEKAYKEASTDALKRCLRLFGNAMGNCLYDKKYLNNVAKMKAPNPPFNPQTLRRAEGMENANVGANTATTSSSTKPYVGNNHLDKMATSPQSTNFTPQNIVPQNTKTVERDRTDVNGASSVLQNKTNAIDAARQERLHIAAMKQEELRRKKSQNEKGQQLAMATNESSSTVNSTSAMPYTVQLPEGDEYDDEFGDITSSQLNNLSRHDSLNDTLASNQSTLVQGHHDPVTVKVCPSRAYNVGNEQQLAYQRGGVVNNEKHVESYELPFKRQRNF